jgi:hypothetical protein
MAVLAGSDDVVGDLPPDAADNLRQLDFDRDGDIATGRRLAPLEAKPGAAEDALEEVVNRTEAGAGIEAA